MEFLKITSQIAMWGIGLFVIVPVWIWLISYMQAAGWSHGFKASFFDTNTNKTDKTDNGKTTK